MGGHLICEDLLAIGEVFDSTPQEVADWAAVNSVEVAQARGFEPRPCQESPGDSGQQVLPHKEGPSLVAFDEEQPAPPGPPPPMPRAGTSTGGGSGKLSSALHRLFPNGSFGSEGSDGSHAHQQHQQQQRKKKARAKGNVVVVHTTRSSGPGPLGDTPVLVRAWVHALLHMSCLLNARTWANVCIGLITVLGCAAGQEQWCAALTHAAYCPVAAEPTPLPPLGLPPAAAHGPLMPALGSETCACTCGRWFPAACRVLSPVPVPAPAAAHVQEVPDVLDQDQRLLRSASSKGGPTSAAASYSSR
jgi:hypothetical protein